MQNINRGDTIVISRVCENNDHEILLELPTVAWEEIKSLVDLASMRNNFCNGSIIEMESTEIVYLAFRMKKKFNYCEQLVCRQMMMFDCNFIPDIIQGRIDEYRADIAKEKATLEMNTGDKVTLITHRSGPNTFKFQYKPFYKGDVRKKPWEIQLNSLCGHLSQENMECIVHVVDSTLKVANNYFMELAKNN